MEPPPGNNKEAIDESMEPHDDDDVDDDNDDDDRVDGKTQHVGTEYKVVKRKRSLQHVVPIQQRKQVVKWMEAEFNTMGAKNLFAKTIAQFPRMFRGTYQANIQKASVWWKLREQHDANVRLTKQQQHYRNQAVPARSRKAFAGRGRKTTPWVAFVHAELYQSYTTLCQTGMRFTTALLVALAKDILHNSTGEFNSDTKDKDGKLIVEKINTSWIQLFKAKYKIVLRPLTEKKKPTEKKSPSNSPQKEQQQLDQPLSPQLQAFIDLHGK